MQAPELIQSISNTILKQRSKVPYHDSWENISNTLKFCLMLLSKFYINGNLVFLKNKNTPSELGF